MIFAATEAYWPAVTHIFLSDFLKNGSDVSLFSHHLTDMTSKYNGEWLGNHMAVLPGPHDVYRPIP